MKCSVTSNATARWEMRIACIGYDAVELTGHLDKSSFHRVVGRPGGSVVKNLPANAGDTGDSGSIPESGRSPGEGNGNPLQYSCLENPMDRGAWWAIVTTEYTHRGIEHHLSFHPKLWKDPRRFLHLYNNLILRSCNLFFFLRFISFDCTGSSLLLAFASCREWGLLFILVWGLLIVMAPLVAEHRLRAHGLRWLGHVGSVVIMHELSCSLACEIFPD